jgi:integrase
MKRHRGEEHEDLREYADHLRAGGDVGELSIMQRLSYLRRLREVYGKPLRELEAKEIEAWLAGLSIGPSSRRTVLVYLRHALKVLNGGEAPELAKRLPKPRGGLNVSRIRTPSELLTEEEVERVAEVFTTKDLSAITLLIYGLGARPSDVLRLRKGDLTVQERQGVRFLEAQIRDSKGRPRVAYTAKPAVIRAIEAWLGAHPGGDLLFPSPRGGGRRHAGAFGITLKKAAKRAGIAKNVYPYLLRHVRASELYDLPAAVRDSQMGWIPGSKMWANYTHLRTEDVRDAILEREGLAAAEMTPEETMERAMAAILELSKDPSQLRAFLEQVQAP